MRTHTRLPNFKRILDIASVVVMTDDKGVITYANDTFCKLSGYSKEEIIGKTHKLVNSDFHPKSFFQDMWNTIKSGNVWRGEIRNKAKDGSLYWVSTTIIPCIDENGAPEQYIAIRTDITKLKQAEAALQTALKNDFQTTIKNLENCIFKFKKNEKEKLVFTLAEGRIAKNIGLVTELVFDKEVKEVFPDDVGQIMHQNFLVAYQGKPVNFEVQIQNIYFLVYLSPIIQDHQVIEVVGTAIDITIRKQSEQLINHMAYHDSLTNLPNRAFFTNRIAGMIQLAKEKKETFAVMFIDLDQFKNINDTLGHSMGDLLLIAVSNRLLDSVQKDQCVFRLGGDEFIILLPESNEEQAQGIAEKIIEQLSSAFIIENHEMYITPSIGISMFPKDGEQLLKNADAAMYQAKSLGRNNFQFFSKDIANKLKRKMYIENELRKAIIHNQFILYYQPQIDITTGKVIGIESLIRWNHPQEGLIPPLDFIPLAEETGLIIPIGEWVLRQACAQNKAWQEAGYEPVPISVNVSLSQFRQKDFVELVETVLRESGLAPKYLELEITESMTMDMTYTERILDSLKALGIKISMDDFGTGYSSLSYLRRLPINKLKIDQSFIRNLDEKNQAIVRTIITLAKNLQMDVIAEGVELAEHADFLKQNDCILAQGYLYSKPLPKEELDQLYCKQK